MSSVRLLYNGKKVFCKVRTPLCSHQVAPGGKWPPAEKSHLCGSIGYGCYFNISHTQRLYLGPELVLTGMIVVS
jgi:hypothetical protein